MGLIRRFSIALLFASVAHGVAAESPIVSADGQIDAATLRWPTRPLQPAEELTWLLPPPLDARNSWRPLANLDDLLDEDLARSHPQSDLIETIVERARRASSDVAGHDTHSLRLKRDGLQHVASTKTQLDWMALSSSVTMREHDDPLDPAFRGAWETGETLKLPMAGPLFAFAQLDASSSAVEQQQYKWLGKYGVGVKIKPWLAPEVQVRGGPAVRYDDSIKPLHGASAERSELFMEAVTKVGLPVVGPLNVEYTSYAIPAATPTDRNQINQDVRLARPLLGGGELHLGARYRWEETASATPWTDRMQVYMGVQLKR